jgi:hypothetical protein
LFLRHKLANKKLIFTQNPTQDKIQFFRASKSSVFYLVPLATLLWFLRHIFCEPTLKQHFESCSFLTITNSFCQRSIYPQLQLSLRLFESHYRCLLQCLVRIRPFQPRKPFLRQKRKHTTFV